MSSTRESHRLDRVVAGIVVLEFAAAVSTFTASTLLPIVARQLHAAHELGWLIGGTALGLFAGLPLAPAVIGVAGGARLLRIGPAVELGCLGVAASARSPVIFGVAQMVGGFAAGLVGVVGVSTGIQLLDERSRTRLSAVMSAMWLIPALVGPPLTLAVAHWAGWRGALLLPAPFMVAGRLLLLRGVPTSGAVEQPRRAPMTAIAVPVGAALLIAASASPPAVAVGSLLTVAGLLTMLPAGVVRLRTGAPAALAAMTLFAVGYFGAGGLITVLFTEGYRVSVGHAALAVSAAPVCWALAGFVAARLEPPPSIGLALAAGGVALTAATGPYPVGLAGWALTGTGVGLAYPVLYVRCTPRTDADTAALATAVIGAEAAGGLLGRTGGGALLSLVDREPGLLITYAAYAGLLAAAALAAARSGRE